MKNQAGRNAKNVEKGHTEDIGADPAITMFAQNTVGMQKKNYATIVFEKVNQILNHFQKSVGATPIFRSKHAQHVTSKFL